MQRREKRRKQAAKALAAAGAIAGGTQAYAAPVRFDNPAHGEPGHFHWATAPGQGANRPDLNITLPAAQQPGVANDPTSIANVLDATNAPQAVAGGAVAGIELRY